MKQYTLKDIDKLDPCYHPTQFLPKNWKGTLVDILNIKDCPAIDRIWVVTSFLDDKTNRLFAVWCAREALKLVDSPDERSVNACNVAEKFANGEATKEELAAACADACADACGAAYSASSAYAFYDAYASWSAADAASASASAYTAYASWSAADAAAYKENQLKTADICRELLTEAVNELIKL